MENKEDKEKEESINIDDDSSELDTESKEIDMDEKLLNSGFLAPAKEKPKRKTFSDSWGSVDELCPTCGNVSKQAEGLNKQNLKRLLSIQTDTQSLTILFLMIMCGLFAFSTYSYMTASTNCTTNVTDLLISDYKGTQFIPMFDTYECGPNITCNVSDIHINLSDIDLSGINAIDKT